MQEINFFLHTRIRHRGLRKVQSAHSLTENNNINQWEVYKLCEWYEKLKEIGRMFFLTEIIIIKIIRLAREGKRYNSSLFT